VNSGSVVQVTLWNSPYLGNFMWSELMLAATVRERLGLSTHFVLDHGAEGRPWLADLEAAGTTWSVLPDNARAWRDSLRTAIERHQGVLVHANFTAADLPTAAVAHRARVPCVWHLRTGFNGYPLAQRAKDLVKMRLIARTRVQRILAVSPWLGEFARRRGAPADRVVVLPDPTVFERFELLPDRSEARARLGLDEQAMVVLALGWWPQVKGVDLLIDAVAALTERFPRMQLLLVGEQAMRDFLDERLGLLPPWLRLSPFVEDPAWLYAAADLFVSASRHEGQSSAIGEALACGLPVVMSDIPGTAPWGQAPHVLDFPSENAEALAAQIERLLRQPGEMSRAAGAENRVWSREHASVSPWAERLCSIYGELLGAGSGGRPAYQHAARDGQIATGQLAERE
jgi:glycosyltransferase involved in cell wall biosynthesis